MSGVYIGFSVNSKIHNNHTYTNTRPKRWPLNTIIIGYSRWRGHIYHTHIPIHPFMNGTTNRRNKGTKTADFPDLNIFRCNLYPVLNSAFDAHFDAQCRICTVLSGHCFTIRSSFFVRLCFLSTFFPTGVDEPFHFVWTIVEHYVVVWVWVCIVNHCYSLIEKWKLFELNWRTPSVLQEKSTHAHSNRSSDEQSLDCTRK